MHRNDITNEAIVFSDRLNRLVSPSEEEEEEEAAAAFGRLVRCCFAPLGMSFVMKTLEDDSIVRCYIGL